MFDYELKMKVNHERMEYRTFKLIRKNRMNDKINKKIKIKRIKVKCIVKVKMIIMKLSYVKLSLNRVKYLIK